MLAYNYGKYSSKLDPVREILAKLDAKQTKTGLSLYNHQQDHSPSQCLTPLDKTGSSPRLQEDTCRKDFFPNLKAARKKAQDRITAAESTDQAHYPTKKQTRSKKIPHRLPEATSLITHPLPHSIDRHDDRINQSYTIPDTQFDRDKIDININPFGYNRKTLAFDERNINYVVEWPETWPFKITSFQGKSKQAKRKPKKINRPKDPVFSPPSFPHDDQSFPWKPTTHAARVLAPVDHPTKPLAFPSRPFVESAVKRSARKIHSKKELRKFVLNSRERDFNFSSQSGDHFRREDSDVVDPGKRVDLKRTDQRKEDKNDNQRPQQETESERVDSVPPSTPVQDVQPKEKRKKKPECDEEIHQGTKDLLNDIVNQIINEEKTPI